MTDDDINRRVHIIGGGEGWLQHHAARLWIARHVTRDDDVTGIEGLAATYDEVIGGDDATVGAHMTMLANVCRDPREYIERVLLALDLLRTAQRTRH
jgi:hypothetical protein